ncbi:MAG: ATP-binding protein [Opitutaceae bacterium]|nr:ATP-binding protein [Opitutaceae bacterium]
MISRPQLLTRLREALNAFPVVALIGPRQSGKTTLARAYAGENPAGYFDLEDPTDVSRLQNPKLALEGLRGLVVIDEIQRQPALFPLLRVLADRRETPARFLVLGSAAPDLLRETSETLAGRMATIEVSGFELREVGSAALEPLWLRGGFPRAFLADSDQASLQWRLQFVQTFLERDLAQLGIGTAAPEALRRFWTMLAHFHGQIWNGAEFARALGTAESTARRHLDLLAGARVARVLPPWFENVGKRIVKSPKVYVRDSGLVHALLQLPAREDLLGHPKVGASWEGFVIEHLVRWLDAERDGFYWATHAGAELDFLVVRRGRRWGFEIKFNEAPGTTRSMHTAIADLNLERLWVIHPGTISFPLTEKIQATPLGQLAAELAQVGLMA